MSVNTVALVTATTGGTAVIGAATFTLLGVEIPTMSFIVAVALGVIVRLYVNRKSAKKRISMMDNLMLSSITVIISVGIVVEYKLSFFYSIMVSGGICFAGEAVLVTLGDQMVGIIKDTFALLKSKMGITKSSGSSTPAVTPTNASTTPSQPLTAPTPTPSTPSIPDDPDA